MIKRYFIFILSIKNIVIVLTILPIKYRRQKNISISFKLYPILYNSTEENTKVIFLAKVDSKIKILYLLILSIYSPLLLCIFSIL